MQVTERQMWVLKYLAARERQDKGQWVSPTEIGREVRASRLVEIRPTRSSAWACPKLKALLELKLVSRNETGQYRATAQGRELAEGS